MVPAGGRPARLRAVSLTSLAAVALFFACAALALPAIADAAGTIYWTTGYESSEEFGYVKAGGIGGELEGLSTTLFQSEEEQPNEIDGIALDPKNGKVYWAEEGAGQIMVANIEGQGSPEVLYEGQDAPVGLDVDPAAGKIYWANWVSGEIMAGGLGGEKAGQKPETLFSEGQTDLESLAIDHAAGKIVWTNTSTDTIMAGGITGETGGATAEALYEASEPIGVAVDEATGEIYWSSAGSESGAVMTGSIEGEETNPAEQLFEEGNWGIRIGGVALNPTTGKIYWANTLGQIMTDELAGEGAGGPPKPLFTESHTFGLALLGAPAAAGAPTISGGGEVGQARLACGEGSWGQDQPGSYSYQAPRAITYRWLNDDVPVRDATSASFTPTDPGSYTCRVTAVNAAGSTVQASAAVTVSAVPSGPPKVELPPPTCDPAACQTHPSRLSIVSHRAVVLGKYVRVKLACEGVEECTGTLSLKYTVRKRANGHGKGTRTVTITLARNLYDIPASKHVPAGKHAVLTLYLSRRALKLISHAHAHEVKATATATVEGGQATRRKIVLARKKPKMYGKGNHRKASSARATPPR